MKKKILFAVFTIICMSISAITSIKKKVSTADYLNLGNIEALARAETDCINNPSKNNGDCDEKVDGSGYVCVKGGFNDDCYR